VSIKKLTIAIATSIALATTAVAPAYAVDFAAVADKTTSLVAAGDTVTVTLSDLPANAGVYVRLCKGSEADVLVARPTTCFGQGSWVSLNPTALGMGATTATVPVALAVQAAFTASSTAVDCLVDACGIHIRKDHFGGSTDFSLDRFIPVTFAAPVVVTPPTSEPTASPVVAPAAPAVSKVTHSPGKVTFTIVNKKGKTVTIYVGTRRVVKKITTANFKVTVAAPTRGWFYANAYVSGVKILSKKFTN
jgi:hypothetical protein